ncbi:MAG: cyclic nucleotide-binding domain-containing protein, partial [Vicinamibacteria bacterium]|nr:cyclic nucleotide-binding domain-containing protein [Vicinamibacteria bacterium]
APAPAAAPRPAAAPAPPPRPATGSGPLVVEAEAGEEQKLLATPLFEGFAPEELEDVIGALRLAQFEPGEILVSEGEPGNSLFILTSGTVRAFVRDASGHNAQVRRLREGDFLGEISLLSGAARTATITAATPVDALELDRPAFDAIVGRHPRVGDVLRRFYEQRRNSAAEAEVRSRG